LGEQEVNENHITIDDLGQMLIDDPGLGIEFRYVQNMNAVEFIVRKESNKQYFHVARMESVLAMRMTDFPLLSYSLSSAITALYDEIERHNATSSE
jgi:hypothetical protein